MRLTSPLQCCHVDSECVQAAAFVAATELDAAGARGVRNAAMQSPETLANSSTTGGTEVSAPSQLYIDPGDVNIHHGHTNRKLEARES